MTNRERKINDCYHISNFIEILSKYFKLGYSYMEKSSLDFVHNEKYVLIDTDIEMNVKYFDDRLVNEIVLKTWNNGFDHQQEQEYDKCRQVVNAVVYFDGKPKPHHKKTGCHYPQVSRCNISDSGF